MAMDFLTPHARARMQQRGISAASLEALLDHGRARHLHAGGREIVYFDKKTRTADLPRIYAIMGSNGVVITVGHRYRRVARD
jgi:hypothetical protein